MSRRIYGMQSPVTPLAGTRRQRIHSADVVRRERAPAFRLFAAASSLPHPGKKNDGEDAYYMTECGMSMGVSDGVGGWAELGVDAGVYSRELCDNAARLVANTGESNPKKIIQIAYDNSSSVGSATMCCLTIQDDTLSAANLGDSKFVLLRPTANGLRVIGESEDQQHYFNCPLQLGRGSNDMPANAHEYEFKVQEGDIVIMGTDGLFDNLGVDEIIDELESLGFALTNDFETLEKLASHLSTTALLVSKDLKVMTPFARSANDHGIPYQGGKLDDITVAVAVIAPHFAHLKSKENKPSSTSSTSCENPAKRFYLPPTAFSLEEEDDEASSPNITQSTPIVRSAVVAAGSPESYMSMSQDGNDSVDPDDNKWHDF